MQLESLEWNLVHHFSTLQPKLHVELFVGRILIQKISTKRPILLCAPPWHRARRVNVCAQESPRCHKELKVVLWLTRQQDTLALIRDVCFLTIIHYWRTSDITFANVNFTCIIDDYL